MITKQTHSTYLKNSRSRRVKSEVPDFFKEQSFMSLKKADSKRSFSKLIENQQVKSKSRLENIIVKHRDVILLLLKKNSIPLDDETIKKLKEITSYPDFLTDVIFKNIRGFVTSTSSPNQYIEEILEYKKQTTNLKTQLFKAKQSNEELTNMLLSV